MTSPRRRPRPPGATTAGGWGYRHQQLRKQFAAIVDAGLAHCWRCGKWLDPAEPWHLGHDDDDRSVYRGPECVPCNTATAGRRKERTTRRWVV